MIGWYGCKEMMSVNKEMVIKTIKAAQEDVQKFFNENRERQKLQEQLLEQTEMNLNQLKREEKLISYLGNKIDIIENYLDFPDTDKEENE